MLNRLSACIRSCSYIAKLLANITCMVRNCIIIHMPAASSLMHMLFVAAPSTDISINIGAISAFLVVLIGILFLVAI